MHYLDKIHKNERASIKKFPTLLPCVHLTFLLKLCVFHFKIWLSAIQWQATVTLKYQIYKTARASISKLPTLLPCAHSTLFLNAAYFSLQEMFISDTMAGRSYSEVTKFMSDELAVHNPNLAPSEMEMTIWAINMALAQKSSNTAILFIGIHANGITESSKLTYQTYNSIIITQYLQTKI